MCPCSSICRGVAYGQGNVWRRAEKQGVSTKVSNRFNSPCTAKSGDVTHFTFPSKHVFLYGYPWPYLGGRVVEGHNLIKQ